MPHKDDERRRQYNLEYRIKNRERLTENSHKYYLTHKDTEKWKQYRQRDHEKQRLKRQEEGYSTRLIAHHIKYKEIHGEDKIIYLTPVEHVRLHQQLAKDERYIKPSKEIIVKAKNRAAKDRDYRLKYRHSDAGKQKQTEYRHKYQHRFLFTYGFESSLRLMESVTYNTSTDTITFTSAFYSTKVSLKRIEEHEPILSEVPSYI